VLIFYVILEQAQLGSRTPVEYPSGRRQRQHTGVYRSRIWFRAGKRTCRHSRDASPSDRR